MRSLTDGLQNLWWGDRGVQKQKGVITYGAY